MPIQVGPDGRATYIGTITGNGSALTFDVTHNLGMSAGKYTVEVTDSNGALVFVGWTPKSGSTTTDITLVFAPGMAPANGVVYNVVITGNL